MEGNAMLNFTSDYDLYQMAADMLDDFCVDLDIEPCAHSYGQPIFSPANEQRLSQASHYLREMIHAARALGQEILDLGLDQEELHDYFLDHLSEMVLLSLEQEKLA
jgi:sugar phosphate isomerase/epimerase